MYVHEFDLPIMQTLYNEYAIYIYIYIHMRQSSILDVPQMVLFSVHSLGINAGDSKCIKPKKHAKIFPQDTKR